ncbi:MAG: Nucleotidyltransferase substrate binding protein, HI0074 family [candidate division TM6 bacterium GW2011_GWE2_42_60]|nr:MAG: Nucleotidyltransferase substrate binding protein, HI0074 family [candidate division TM6 bacterium GW2011_GWE2_42_60]HBY05728.1 nucleotidyltransferase [Candidatus Dependentiae bacterium]
MERLKKRHEQLLCLLNTLDEAILAMKELELRGKSFNPKVDYEDEYRTYRDSVVQRFEYTIDLFWKYLKNYLEVAQVVTGLKIPSEVMREAFSLRLLSEEETEKILEMIKSRNMTSHIYIEEIAERLALNIPEYYQLLQKLAERLKP